MRLGTVWWQQSCIGHPKEMVPLNVHGPKWLVQQSLPRNDQQIQGKEVLGVLLAFTTSHDCLKRQVLENILRQFSNAQSHIQWQCRHHSSRPRPVGRKIVVIGGSRFCCDVDRQIPSHSTLPMGQLEGRMELLEQLGRTEEKPGPPQWVAMLWNPFQICAMDI
jgi:hypothetical protein